MTARNLFTAAVVGLLIPVSARASEIVYPAYGESETKAFAGVLIPASVQASDIVYAGFGRPDGSVPIALT